MVLNDFLNAIKVGAIQIYGKIIISKGGYCNREGMFSGSYKVTLLFDSILPSVYSPSEVPQLQNYKVGGINVIAAGI